MPTHVPLKSVGGGSSQVLPYQNLTRHKKFCCVLWELRLRFSKAFKDVTSIGLHIVVKVKPM